MEPGDMTVDDLLRKSAVTESALPEEVLDQLETRGDVVVDQLITALGDAELRSQATAALAHFPRWSINSLIDALVGDFCDVFRVGEDQAEGGKTCQFACDVLSEPLVLIARAARLAGDVEVMRLFQARASELISAFESGCGSARYRREDVLPEIGLVLLPELRSQWPDIQWDEIEAVALQGPERITTLFASGNMMGSLCKGFVVDVCAGHGREAVRLLVPELGNRAVGAPDAAACALVTIGTADAILPIIDYQDSRGERGIVHELVYAFGSARNPAEVDLLLAQALANEPSPYRILAVAESARSLPGQHLEAKGAVAKVIVRCGDAQAKQFGEDKSVAELVQRALSR